IIPPLPNSTLFPYTTLFRSGPQLLDLGRLQRAFLRRSSKCFSLSQDDPALCDGISAKFHSVSSAGIACRRGPLFEAVTVPDRALDRKSTRLNSSHRTISYAV